jgi:catechol-2,3-dioxygenase
VAFGVAAAEFVAWRRHLESRLGRPIEAVDHQLAWSIYFADPDGNPYEITTYDHALVVELLQAG